MPEFGTLCEWASAMVTVKVLVGVGMGSSFL